jgi:hypothetical protein
MDGNIDKTRIISFGHNRKYYLALARRQNQLELKRKQLQQHRGLVDDNSLEGLQRKIRDLQAAKKKIEDKYKEQLDKAKILEKKVLEESPVSSVHVISDLEHWSDNHYLLVLAGKDWNKTIEKYVHFPEKPITFFSYTLPVENIKEIADNLRSLRRLFLLSAEKEEGWLCCDLTMLLDYIRKVLKGEFNFEAALSREEVVSYLNPNRHSKYYIYVSKTNAEGTFKVGYDRDLDSEEDLVYYLPMTKKNIRKILDTLEISAGKKSKRVKGDPNSAVDEIIATISKEHEHLQCSPDYGYLGKITVSKDSDDEKSFESHSTW